MTFWKRQNYADSKKTTGFQGFRESGEVEKSFQGSETMLYDAIMVDTFNTHLPEPLGCASWKLWILVHIKLSTAAPKL